LIDNLPLTSPIEEVNGYVITSTIYDMQARFNINNLINQPAQMDFKKLLHMVDPDVTEEKAQTLLLAIVDWIQLQQNSEFTQYYSHLPQPYLASHKLMVSVSELQLVKGMTPALFAALQPYVTALPTSTLINVQTAPPPVLASLSRTMTEASGKAIVEAREEHPFVSNEIFRNLDIVKNHPIAGEKFTVLSSYFLVETHIAIEKQEVVLYTLLERVANQDSAALNILWQSKGIW
jgi:general secretion pathway protein K